MRIVVDRYPRRDSAEMLYEMFVGEKRFPEMTRHMKEHLHRELDTSEMVEYIQSEIYQIRTGTSEDVKKLLSALSNLLRPGLLDTSKPVVLFVDEIIKVLNEQALELSLKTKRDDKVNSQVLFAFLDTIKLLVVMKREIEAAKPAPAIAYAVKCYHYALCEVFDGIIKECLPLTEYSDLNKKFRALTFNKITAFAEKYEDNNGKIDMPSNTEEKLPDRKPKPPEVMETAEEN